MINLNRRKRNGLKSFAQAACPPALASQPPTAREGAGEPQKRKLEGKGVREIVRETMEMNKEEVREQRPLYESIYSLAGSPGAPRLDQLHPLHLQVPLHLLPHPSPPQIHFL